MICWVGQAMLPVAMTKEKYLCVGRGQIGESLYVAAKDLHPQEFRRAPHQVSNGFAQAVGRLSSLGQSAHDIPGSVRRPRPHYCGVSSSSTRVVSHADSAPARPNDFEDCVSRPL